MDIKMNKLKIAIIGQSDFAAEILENLLNENYSIVGVFTIPNKGNKEDILAITAAKHKIPVFKFSAWRKKGIVIPEVLEQYKAVEANLNILPYCSQFIPMEVIDGAALGSICYHPSLLPRHRGASSISWTLIEGDEIGGFTIFWADDGLDTGPILLQRQCPVDSKDTLDTFYRRFLYPEGIKAMIESVEMVSKNCAPKIKQTEMGATYDPALFKIENQDINFKQNAVNLFNFIRGLDSVPGARAVVYIKDTDEEIPVRLFGASLYDGLIPEGLPLHFRELSEHAIVHDDGIIIQGVDQKMVNIKRIKRGNRIIMASSWYEKSDIPIDIELNEHEKHMEENLKNMWFEILNVEIENQTDFFECGGGSMDVVRLVEEVKDKFELQLDNEMLLMNPIFNDFFITLIITSRKNKVKSVQSVGYNGFWLKANKKEIQIPTQLFINGEFINAENDHAINIVNPTTEEIICRVACASVNDVDYAVKSAYKAFHGSWSHLTPRQRGQIMFKLADLMEEHIEELATIESVDSGAVYTLALKTHVGMSIESWRYFAGWTDKIEGTTIPVSPARPNNVLTYTKKEPIGVVGLITPWNYPLMMLSWKMSACIAAGNTVVIKPAQVCPLTALKFAELTVKAGFPPGVINVVTGTGSKTGQAILEHPLVRKIGFTGSTEIGKSIMMSCAKVNLKKCSLELGGKSPLIIFADCDLDKAVRNGMSSVFFNKGENCISAGRLFVEDKIHDEFVKKVLQNIKTMRIGDPLDRATSHGPQNHKEHLLKLIEYCEIGVKEGAKLLTGGNRVPNLKGWFFEPTVFTNVKDDMFIAKEESFGPIMIISTFNASDVDGVIKRANKTEYGLASGVFTRDINKALMFADKIDAGTVFINTYNKTDVAAPFGGFKQSGFGKDLGRDALNEYLKVKNVTIEY